jgi:hypothetical protein
MEALKRTVREYERQLQQAKVASEEDKQRAESDRVFAQKQVMVTHDACCGGGGSSGGGSGGIGVVYDDHDTRAA